MKSIAIIPARGGSQRIPGKNTKDFHGRPIIYYSIDAARESKLFDEIIVSTDSAYIKNCVLTKYIVETVQTPVYVKDRNEYMSRDSVGTYAVTRDAVEDVDDEDLVCCIYATAPMMSVTDLQLGHMYMNTMSLAHCVSVGTDPLQDAAQFYWSRGDALKAGVPLFGISTGILPVHKSRVCDINTPEDWDRAEKMYSLLHEGKK